MPGTRLLLSLAYPLLEEVLRERDQEEELVLLLPGFRSQEVRARVRDFLEGAIKVEVKEEEAVKESDQEDLDGDIEDFGGSVSDGDNNQPHLEASSKNYQHFDHAEEISCGIKFPCEECNSEFQATSEEELKQHKLEVHVLDLIQREAGSYACNYCGETFHFDSTLRRHITKKHYNEKHDDEAETGEGSRNVICPICDQSASHKSALKIHMARWHPEITERRRLQEQKERETRKELTYDCDICALQCQTMSELRFHKKGVHEEGGSIRVTCEDCGMTLFNKGTLKKHRGSKNCIKGQRSGQKERTEEEQAKRREQILLHGHGAYTVHCTICVITFKTFEECRDHRKTHKEGNLWKCREEDCGKTFKQRKQIVFHMQRHRGQFNHTCNICNKKFVTNTSYDIHMKVHNGEFNFRCVDCQKPFVTESSFDRHMTNVHGKSKLCCKVCGKIFNTGAKLEKHMIYHEEKPLKQAEIQELMCHLCSTVIRSRYGKQCLAKHMRKKHFGMMGEDLHKCAECDRSFKSKKNLRVHMQNIHEGLRHFCDQCGSSFSVKQNLLNHINVKHVDPEKKLKEIYNCKECGKGFGRPFNVCNSHTYKDRSLKLTCDRCGFVTKGAQQLRHHQLSSRCDPSKVLVRKFHCTECGKGFTTEKSLRKHEKDFHIVGKPFKCEMCNMGFTHSWGVTKHVKKGHCKAMTKAQGQVVLASGQHKQWGMGRVELEAVNHM